MANGPIVDSNPVSLPEKKEKNVESERYSVTDFGKYWYSL